MRTKAKKEPVADPEKPDFQNENPLSDEAGPERRSGSAEDEQPKKWFETSKLIVWVCLINGFLWVWCSYVLAWFGRNQIAESLSQVALTEIIGVVLIHCIKTVIENLSKNNKWPDKSVEGESSDDVR